MGASGWDRPSVGSGREREGVDLPTPSAGQDRSERGERLGRRWMLAGWRYSSSSHSPDLE